MDRQDTGAEVAGNLACVTALERLRERLGQVTDLERAAALLEWDQQVNMPAGGGEARAEQMATVQSLAHELFVADEVGELLAAAEQACADLPPESDPATIVRVTREDYERERRVPQALVAERARVTSAAFAAWQAARAEADFEGFRPYLERVLDVTVRYAQALSEGEAYETLYDALLDEYEPGMRTRDVADVFAQVRDGLVELVDAIAAAGRPGAAPIFDGAFDADAQWAFGIRILEDMGFDLTHGRQDRSAHPFTTAFSPQDVRTTTRIKPDDLRSGLFATIHEGGHALYEQGLPLTLDRTPAGQSASFSLHESQSRLWENLVGRSRAFWSHYLPQLREAFPARLGDVDLDNFYRAINVVEPSLIRVEADEVTYNLHIFLRFELEQDLLAGRLAVADLPEAWNGKMEAYLGVAPPDDAAGVLQDVHWSMGLLGYFPSYALGNLLAVQFYDQAADEIADLRELIAAGRLSPLREWLREEIHQHGRRYEPDELVRRVTGGPLDARPYLRYLNEKYSALYNLSGG